ncbi:hypothetical protein F5148DRAFT_1284834 [Russula earlei]|uniref:Uncharacterized protein n=1 Tax=Russula earlei TaxID=71964 RepID=A0ACC0U8J3_9AGAM|nr:hypothetical protein F5148DRAFT_1284834 [Russula earlei]
MSLHKHVDAKSLSPRRLLPPTTTDRSIADRVTIEVLPDNVLVEIFDLYVNHRNAPVNEWHTLIHVCRRWRHLIFVSPRRLGLQLEYRGNRPRTVLFGGFPALPLVITQSRWYASNRALCVDNIVSILVSEEHLDRIFKLDLWNVPSLHWERIAVAMQKPFPQLTFLQLGSKGGEISALSDSFLGGSAPLLRSLRLFGIPFPAMHRLVSSAKDLVTLHLRDIPHRGYISPQSMVDSLSALARLEILFLSFQSPQSRPDPPTRRPPPLAPSVLPALTYFRFRGVSEYLEDMFVRMDAPLLHDLHIEFFMDLIFDVPQLHRFISHPEELRKLRQATVNFSRHYVTITLSHRRTAAGHGQFWLQTRCRESDWLLSCVAQVCRSSLPPLSVLDHLYIMDDRSIPPRWKDVESTQWLELLDPFTAVKNLFLTEDVAIHFGHALQQLGAQRATAVLPALQTIFLKDYRPQGPVQGAIRQFVSARQSSRHPVAIRRWEE